MLSRTHMTMLPKKGFCYAAINKSMPGLVKIGCTERSPYLRVRQLFTTSVPEPFVLMAYISCEAPRHMEAKIHKHFETVSVSPNREFFRVSGGIFCPNMSRLSQYTPTYITCTGNPEAN